MSRPFVYVTPVAAPLRVGTPFAFDTLIGNPDAQDDPSLEREVEVHAEVLIHHDEGESVDGRVVVAPYRWVEVVHVTALRGPHQGADIRGQIGDLNRETIEEEGLEAYDATQEARASEGRS